MFNIFPPKIVPFNEKMWKYIAQADRLQMTYMAHALCMLDNQGYRHTLRMCNTYLFSTAKNDSRRRLNVTFTLTLPVLFAHSNGYSHVLVHKFL
jgi:hypothetical protein